MRVDNEKLKAMIRKRPIPLRLATAIAEAPLMDEADVDRLPNPSRSKLSPREKEVLEYSSVGLTAEMIADILGITLFTVKDHRRNSIRRLAAKNITHAVAIALREGIID